jgi:AP-3 complex subunit delta-1
VASHPYLVSLHQDVILECIDDMDISIRMRALNLVVGMVNTENLTTIVDRLLCQLMNAPLATDAEEDEPAPLEIGLYAEESDDEDAAEERRQKEARQEEAPSLPEDYRVQVIQNILAMCAKDTYSTLNDFEWYLDVLVKLVKACPMVKNTTGSAATDDISYEIGREIQNVAVRVKSMRPEATVAAQSLVIIDNRDKLFPSFSNGGQGVLEACAWLVGEYADDLTDPEAVLNSILHSATVQLPSNILSVHIQAMLKVFARLTKYQSNWTSQRRTDTTLLLGRVIYFLEPLASHPALEIQELAVEYLELMRLASEAASSQPVSKDAEYADPPLLLTQAIPDLFSGQELNPVAPGAQKRVEAPPELDLDTPINQNLESILADAENDVMELEHDDFEDFYYKLDETVHVPEAAADRLDLAAKVEPYSYQNSEDDRSDPEKMAKIRAKQRDRNRDDPFYIGGEESSASSKLHNILKTSNGDDLDIDSIPIMALNLAGGGSSTNLTADRERAEQAEKERKAARRKKIQIVGDETLGGDDIYGSDSTTKSRAAAARSKKFLLNIDSSGLGALSLDGNNRGSSKLEIEQREEEEKALREVERLRLEMQRASERIQAKEETVVKKKKKKVIKPPKTATDEAASAEPAGEVVAKRRKKKPTNGEAGAEGTEAVKPKKKRRQIDMTAPTDEAQV